MVRCKRILAAALAGLLLLCAMAMPAFAEEEGYTLEQIEVMGINEARAANGKGALTEYLMADIVAMNLAKNDAAVKAGTMTQEAAEEADMQALNTYLKTGPNGTNITNVTVIRYYFDSQGGTCYPLDYSWLDASYSEVSSDAQYVGNFFLLGNDGIYYNVVLLITAA